VTLLLAASPVQATVVSPMTMDDLARQADVIVRAAVVSRHAAWDGEGRFIHTYTELRVTQAWKGPAAHGETLWVRQLGGTVGADALLLAGNASFEVGEDVIVYLHREAALGLHFVVGMAQGKLSVQGDGPAARVTRNLADLTFVADRATPVRAGVGTLSAWQRALRSSLQRAPDASGTQAEAPHLR